eukprot:TRINITY_DN863_c1_g1_i1.p1 TRINITY_DN863_c1_g1~~TRINITY_DN863_c1_g1_i1.p1  ORF type:complete len:257 (+),score=65.61 TRINITY_DN863_c1_g1_i1:292-1062(+)
MRVRKRAVSGLLFFAATSYGMYAFVRSGMLANLLYWIGSLGYWGNVLVALCYIVIAFPVAVAYVPVTLAAGFLYGVVGGTITVSLGSTAGAVVSFWVCRTLLSEYLEAKIKARVGKGFSQFMEGVGQNGFKITFLSRLSPFPFGVANALFALSPIEFNDFITATFIGLMPMQIILTYFGSTLRNISEAVSGSTEFGFWQRFMLIVECVVGVGLIVYISYVGKNSMGNAGMMAKNEEDEVEEEEDEDYLFGMRTKVV